jgi:hypothetical protein
MRIFFWASTLKGFLCLEILPALVYRCLVMPRIARVLSPDSMIAPAMQAARGLLSVLLMVSVLAASLHHLSCAADDLIGGAAVTSVASTEPQAPPTGGEPCLPGHCHCVCHVAQATLPASSFLVVFTESAYNSLQNDPLPSLRAYPPFKPPRA